MSTALSLFLNRRRYSNLQSCSPYIHSNAYFYIQYLLKLVQSFLFSIKSNPHGVLWPTVERCQQHWNIFNNVQILIHTYKPVNVPITEYVLSLAGCHSCLRVYGFGTCRPVRATPSSWLMETASSRSSCTAASIKSQCRRRVRGHTRIKGHTRGHLTGRRVIQSDPPCCRYAWRFVGQKCTKLFECLFLWG